MAITLILTRLPIREYQEWSGTHTLAKKRSAAILSFFLFQWPAMSCKMLRVHTISKVFPAEDLALELLSGVDALQSKRAYFV